MIDQKRLFAQRRGAHRPQWGGLVPTALFARLEAEPQVGNPLSALGDALLETVDGRMLEFVALRSSAVRGCLYMWRGHCRIARQRRPRPIRDDEIARIAAGPGAFESADAAVLEAIDELLVDRRLSAGAREAIGDGGLILTVAVLFYETVAIIMRDVPPEADPIEGLETPAIAARSAAR